VTDEAPSPVTDEASSTQPAAPAGSAALVPAQTPGAPEQGASVAADRPEIIVGAAFAAGFTFAMLLRRLVR
jgi:hypothetical protein